MLWDKILPFIQIFTNIINNVIIKIGNSNDIGVIF